MDKCECGKVCKCKHHKMHHGIHGSGGPLGFFGLLAYIGAVIYFIGVTNGGFWAVILALLKAIIWPVYVVYNVLRVLGAA